jgi:hypothetical protein
MKQHRNGAPRRFHFRHDPWNKYGTPRNAIIEIKKTKGGEPWGKYDEDELTIKLVIPNLLDIDANLLPKDLMRILAKRYEELKARNYPDEWIEKDLKKLVEGI